MVVLYLIKLDYHVKLFNLINLLTITSSISLSVIITGFKTPTNYWQ